MTTLKRINEILIIVFLGIVTIILGFILINSFATKPAFEYQNFTEKQEGFKKCVNNEELFIDAKNFQQHFLDFDLETITNSFQIFTNNGCDASHVVSNFDQVKQMALLVLEDAKAFYEIEDVKVVNSVYTTNMIYSALLDQPQTYLFYALTADESRIIAITIRPDNDNYVIERLWNYENTDDLDFTQTMVQKLLLVYNEVKR